jgi:hypothetical protein
LAKISKGTPASSFSYDRKTRYHQELFKLISSLLNSFGIGRINDIDESIGVGKIVAPILTEGFLSSDVPHVQLELFVG